MANIYRSNISAFLSVVRPQQWIKNAFVWAPLLFSGQFTQLDLCGRAALIFVSFCIVSGAIYVINDLADRHEDKQHPVKRSRPIASGAISPSIAMIYSMILIVIGVAVAWYISWSEVIIVLLYVVMNILYSLALKHMAIVDVMTIAAGFVLRVLGGSVAISVAPSHWLLLCTVMISLFLGFTKRRAELLAATGQARNSRVVLRNYSVAFLDQAISMVTSVTVVCYILYTVDVRTLQVFGTRAMLLTVPSVIYGLFRYIYIIYHLEKGEDPTNTLVRDIPTIVNMIIWIGISLIVVICGNKLDILQ
ncbi:MAG: decaprenyl-phosphate phosphoribosyltransferase [Sedimentisphaerales bacterium]